MNWNTYRKRFALAASSKRYSEEDTRRALSYAKKILKNGLPVIFSANHLSLLVGIDVKYLYKASNDKNMRFYRSFSINKKRGGKRDINEPRPTLKSIQRWILDNILCKVQISHHAKAFRTQSSIKDNARFHLKQDLVLRLDIKDFFPSIKSKSVYIIFRRLGYSKPVSRIITGILAPKSLPQGAPTSPALSNIFMKEADNRISRYCMLHGIRYTRYADDLTFSGSFIAGDVISFVRKIFSEYGLLLNENKTKLMKRHQRQSTTGITVNSFMNPSRKIRRKIRQIKYYINKYGITSHLNYIQNDKVNYIQHVLGLVHHVLYVNPKDRDASSARDMLYSLSSGQRDL